MKTLRSLVSLLVLSFLFIPQGLQSVSWADVVEKVRESIVYVETSGSSCTGFVLDQVRAYVLSAGHCDGEKILVDQRPAKMVMKDTEKDLLVLEVKGLDRPALPVAKHNPRIGDEVASYGYGYGLERPLFRVAHISDDEIVIAESGIGGPYLAIDAAFVPGQSGGPVVNFLGEVVMIVQLGTDRVGLGVGAKTIRDRAGRYLQKP